MRNVQITFDDKDGKALIDSLELEKFNLHDDGKDRQMVHDIHRAFHFRVVRWLQKQGWKLEE